MLPGLKSLRRFLTRTFGPKPTAPPRPPEPDPLFDLTALVGSVWRNGRRTRRIIRIARLGRSQLPSQRGLPIGDVHYDDDRGRLRKMPVADFRRWLRHATRLDEPAPTP